MQAQRNGDMKSFAQLTYEADEIEQQIVALTAKAKTS